MIMKTMIMSEEWRKDNWRTNLFKDNKQTCIEKIRDNLSIF